MRFTFLVTALLMASACQPETGEIRWDGGTQLLSETCPELAPKGYFYVPIEQMREVLQARHEGERISAHLLPNILYCSYVSDEPGRNCYRFSGMNITPDRAVQFCVEGSSVVDFVLEEQAP